MHKAQALVSMPSSDHGIQNNVNNSVEGNGSSGKWVYLASNGMDDCSSKDIAAGGILRAKLEMGDTNDNLMITSQLN